MCLSQIELLEKHDGFEEEEGEGGYGNLANLCWQADMSKKGTAGANLSRYFYSPLKWH